MSLCGGRKGGPDSAIVAVRVFIGMETKEAFEAARTSP
jgi:hypothetical protein